ncbi:MAG: polymer-forming cytoskeletal protein [Chloroflexi bacterium]|nr:polymer-forming cytoskeletal protein [Chloroflexota bacterium]
MKEKKGMVKKISKKIAGILLLVLLLTLVPVSAVHAADFNHGGSVGADEIVGDDVFLSGERCFMDGIVNGNLVAACQTINLNGTVSGDAMLFAEQVIVGKNTVVSGNLFAFAASVDINGTVSGSLASAASTILLDQDTAVARNAYLASYESKMETGSSVGMDLFAGAYQVIVNGNVARDLTVGANALELRGNVGRNAVVELGTGDEEVSAYSGYMPGMQYVTESIPAGLRIYDGAYIGNNLTYRTQLNMGSQFDQFVGGKVVFEQLTLPDTTSQQHGLFSRRNWVAGDFSQFRLTSTFSRLIAYFALGALAFWLFKKQSTAVRDTGYAYPLKAFGWGFLTILIGFMGILLVPLTFIMLGILIGVVSLGGLLFTWYGVLGTVIVLIFVLFFFIVFTLSKVIAAYELGYWLMKDVFKSRTQNNWLDLLVGVLIYIILRAIPYIGWLIGFAASLYGTGVLFIKLTNVEKRKETNKLEAK